MDKLFRDFNEQVYNEILTELANSDILAEDSKKSGNPESVKDSKTMLGFIKAKIDTILHRNPSLIHDLVNGIIARKMMDWLEVSEQKARELVSWYVSNCARDISRAMKKALTVAGIPETVFKLRWKTPQPHQYISPQALERLPSLIDEQTALITRMTATDLARLRDIMSENLTDGRDFGDIERTLYASQGFDEARAKRVALDQTIKINQTIQLENAKSLGITKGVWIHVPGQYSSRPTHEAMNGMEFDLVEGLFDSQVGYNVLPAELPYCRCVWRSVIPDDFLSVSDESD